MFDAKIGYPDHSFAVDAMKKVSGVDFDAEIVADNKKIKTTINFESIFDDLEFICRVAL